MLIRRDWKSSVHQFYNKRATLKALNIIDILMFAASINSFINLFISFVYKLTRNFIYLHQEPNIVLIVGVWMAVFWVHILEDAIRLLWWIKIIMGKMGRPEGTKVRTYSRAYRLAYNLLDWHDEWLTQQTEKPLTQHDLSEHSK